MEKREAFELFFSIIKNLEIKWAVTGSFRLFLDNPLLINPNDIDILTDVFGVFEIEKNFHEYVIKPVSYSEIDTLRSYFGQLKIGQTVFDIFGNVENKIANQWVNIPNLNTVVYSNIFSLNYSIPVLPLTYELEVNQKIGRLDKALIINNILNNTTDAKPI